MGNKFSQRRGHQPSVKDVAELAGVSWTTVSNVIHEHPNVRPETRARVEEAIRTLGYRANPAGRQLRQGRTGTIGVALPQLSTPYDAALAEALMEQLAGRGLVALFEQTGADPDRERRVVEGRLARNVDGVILLPAAMSGLEIARHRFELPLVIIGEDADGAGADQVGIDIGAAARAVTSHLIALGRTSVAFIGHRPRRGRGLREPRLASLVAALRQEGIEIGSRQVVAVDEWSNRAGAAAVQHLLPMIESITAIVCANDDLAFGAMHALIAGGVRIPEDVAVVGWDDVPLSAYANPSLTSVAPDRSEIARLAVDMIAARLDDDVAPPAAKVAPFALAVRQSTAG